jgi:hypothetical protein
VENAEKICFSHNLNTWFENGRLKLELNASRFNSVAIWVKVQLSLKKMGCALTATITLILDGLTHEENNPLFANEGGGNEKEFALVLVLSSPKSSPESPMFASQLLIRTVLYFPSVT